MLFKRKEKNSFAKRYVKAYRKTNEPKKKHSFFKKKKTSNHRKPEVSEIHQDAYIQYGYYILFFAFIGAAFYLFLFSPYIKITHIDLIGLEDIPPEDVLIRADEYVSGAYFGFLPKESFALLFTEPFEEYLKQEFPKIRTLEVEKVFPDELRLNIVEREALMIWCSGGNCFILDEFGHAYEREEDLSYASSLTRVRIIDQSAQQVDLGRKIIDEKYISLFTDLYGAAPDILGTSLDQDIYMSERIAQEAQMQTREGWQIRFSTELSAERSLRMLKTFFEKEFLKKEDREKLEYIDIRVENKVFYKLKDEFLEKEDQEENKIEIDELNDENIGEDDEV